jgi:colicin import membrane protein
MKPGLTISFIGHAAALAFGIVAISAQPMEAPPVETLPVSFISEKDFTQMTQGVKNAPQLKVDMPKPLADKIDAPKAVDQLAPKAADKPAITTDTKPKTEPKPETKPDPKQAAKPDKPKPPEYKPDQIADLLKKDADKKPPKPDDNSPHKPEQNSPKFDANQVAQLLDKRDPRRELASAETLNDKATLGAATGAAAAQLSQSEIDALRARLKQCWNPPSALDSIDPDGKTHVYLRVLLKLDGSLAQPPAVVGGTPSALGPALAESAERAVLTCQPFTMLKPEHYGQWQDLTLDFDSKMFSD